MNDPIFKSVTVPLPPDRAFDLFTRRMGDWWPGETHSISAGKGDLPKAIHVGEKPGDLIEEEAADGSRFEWGRITDYAPGECLSFTWYVGRTEDDATMVTVSFTACEGGTRVDLEHGGWDLADAVAMDRRLGYDTGWDLVLGQCYVAAGRKLEIIA